MATGASRATLPVFPRPGAQYSQIEEAAFRREVERFMESIGNTVIDSASVALHAASHASGGGDPVDHGGLPGLADDDHSLYHTDGRALTWLGTRSTTDLPEGANLYYTSARFDTDFSGKSTTDLSEGTNLYYTDARVKTHGDTLYVELGGDTMTGVLTIKPASAGAWTPNASAFLTVENSASCFIHMATPDANESGILFGEVTKDIRAAIIASATETLIFRTGGNTTRVIIEANGDLSMETVGSKILFDSSTTTYLSRASANYVRVTTPQGYVNIGPGSSSLCHFNTDRGAFSFNKGVDFATGVLKMSGTQVLTTQQSTFTDNTGSVAGATYGTTEKDMLNNHDIMIAAIYSRCVTHGLWA